jgi:uncharacterized membrane protein
MQVVSWLIVKIIILMFGLCLSGSIYICTVAYSMPGRHTSNTTVQMYILPLKQSPDINMTVNIYNNPAYCLH